jgi:hypothetical protein
MVQIRERSTLDLLDLGLVVARRRLPAIAATAAFGIAPFALLNAWLLATFDPPVVIYYFLLFLEIPWATAPLTIVLGGLMFGERPRIRKVLATLGSAMPKLFVYQGIIRAVLTVTLVGLLFIPSRYVFLNEVILLERGSWQKIGARGFALCSERGGELFIKIMAQLFYLVTFVVAFHFALLRAQDSLIGGAVWESATEYDWVGWRTQLGLWIAVSFFCVARFLTYIDQRIRLEGWEVELRLRTAGSLIARDEAW